MRLAALVALVAACQADPCDGRAPTCIAVEARGPSSLTIDQFLVSASGAFTLHDLPTPAELPIAFAVLPGDLDGPFVLTLRARRAGADVAETRGEGALVRGQVLRVILDLTPALPDGGARDLARFVDLAGADLAGQACDP